MHACMYVLSHTVHVYLCLLLHVLVRASICLVDSELLSNQTLSAPTNTHTHYEIPQTLLEDQHKRFAETERGGNGRKRWQAGAEGNSRGRVGGGNKNGSDGSDGKDVGGGGRETESEGGSRQACTVDARVKIGLGRDVVRGARKCVEGSGESTNMDQVFA